MTEQLMDDLTNEEHEALLLMSEHAIAAPLSPAAQAVVDAVIPYPIHEAAIAAALRAAALCCKRDAAILLAIADELEGNHPESPDSSDGPAVSDDREPASVTDQVTHQLHRRATVLLIRKVIDRAIRDTASVHWRVADTGEQLVRASDLVAWADHVEKQMQQLHD